MKNKITFYATQKATLERQLKEIKIQLTSFSILRFGVFLITCFGIYFTFGTIINVSTIAIVGFSLFGFLVVKHTNLKRKKELVLAEIYINNTEIKVVEGDFSFLATGAEFVNPQHYFSNDIDLFGVGSFFQYVNRTATKEGQKKFAETLTENTISAITAKQDSLKELAKEVTWRQRFSAIASLVTIKHSSKTIRNWVGSYQHVFPKYLTYIPVLFSLVSLLIIGLTSFDLISSNIVFAWFFLGLFITGKYIKKIQKLYENADKAKETFRQYHQLLQKIEEANFSSQILKEKQQIIQSEEKKASQIFLQFSKILDAFDQRNNVIIAVMGNAFFLRDIAISLRAEKWISTYKSTVKQWFDVVAFFDAQNSLANFVFNHADFVFPTLKKEGPIITSEKLGHPLLKKTGRVDNDFLIDKEQFFIITGSNMAGKSTFLRTVSLSIVMANIGLPVCAKSFNYSPIKLITSMRTSDSLADDESYFYSELKRLKFIVDEIKSEKYFIVLDEILKGTNSKDKATGSKKFVEKLTNSNATGIIATHDVSLCDLATNFTEINNYYFDADIINNELHFDYTLKNGVCKNMNASFLLEKMKII